jgi:hypothetical protein
MLIDRSIKQELGLCQERVLEGSWDRKKEENIDAIGNRKRRGNRFRGCSLQTEALCKVVKLLVVLDVFLDSIVVTACAKSSQNS